jgi:alanine racemase
MNEFASPVRMHLNGDALIANWRTLSRLSGSAATGAAVKANAYGLGVRDVVARLQGAGCQDFFVAHWAEAAAIADIVPSSHIAVLNGIANGEMQAAMALGAVPVLNTPYQVALWRAAGGGRCHVMLDSGINRLGIGPEQMSAELFDGLDIDILLSHLASADENVPQNAQQLKRFLEMSSAIKARRRSLTNSAGIMLGPEYHFNLTRPGLALYGGVPREELTSHIRQVATLQAQVLQARDLEQDYPVGYNATYFCSTPTRVATVSIGYADGYLRGFSNKGQCRFEGNILPVIGRVSMDLLTLDANSCRHVKAGDWVDVHYNLTEAATISGLSQYELLTGLGRRFDRVWK